MRIWEIQQFKGRLHLGKDPIVCLGYFDGFHRGHQALVAHAKTLGSNVVLLTFDRNPKPGRPMAFLTPFNTRAALLKSAGVQHVLKVAFTEKVQETSPKDFIRFLIALKPKVIVCGKDFKFGHKAEGNVALLQAESIGKYTVSLVDYLLDGPIKISTTNIFEHLENGNVEKANDLLGRPYAVTGTVVKGFQYGRKIGYPTANIKLDAAYFLPKTGIYLTLFKVRNKVYYSMASLGYHPTLSKLKEKTLEVHLLDFKGNLYGQKVSVAFLHYLRDEIAFDGVAPLVDQLKRDEALARAKQASLPKTF